MNESTRKQAERAALVQRFQLDVLHRALQSLEGYLSALESESARQSYELARLAEQIARLRAEADLTRASKPAGPRHSRENGHLAATRHPAATRSRRAGASPTSPSRDKRRPRAVPQSARHPPAARPGRKLGRVHAQRGTLHRRPRDPGNPRPPHATPPPASRGRDPTPIRR